MRIQIVAVAIFFAATWLGHSPAIASDSATPATRPADDLSPLERKFEATLNNATLTGSFTIDGVEKPPRDEHYDIASVRKLRGNLWLFNARIRFGSKDVTVPLILPVEWAGDTPVITVTDVGIPGVGDYTARVLIYDDHYAGFWTGGPTHQGTLAGQIIHSPATQPAKE